MEKTPMVTVELKTLQNFRCTKEEWKRMGGYKGFLQEYRIPIREIQSVKTELLSIDSYPKVTWEG